MVGRLPDHSDTVIVGGGVIGASSAYWLEQQGRRVTVIERRPKLGTLTTPNALGTIRTQYGTPTLIELAKESLAFYRDIEARIGVSPDDLGWANQGYLYLTDNADHIPRLHESLAEYQALGVPSSRFVQREELEQLFPFVGASVAGIFHGDGSWVDPTRITDAWAGACNTTTFVTDTEVIGFDQTNGGGWTVATDAGVTGADNLVVCAGPYAPAALARFGVEPPLKITPRYRAFIPDSDTLHAKAPLVINIANGAYWRPVPGGVWLSTANVDDSSVEPGESVTVPDGFLQLCLEQIESVSPKLAATARALDPADIGYAGGFQVYPADDIPIIGQVPDVPNLFVNYGHWAGVMLSPASGRLLADVVAGRISDADNPCRLGRFVDGVERTSTNKFGGWG